MAEWWRASRRSFGPLARPGYRPRVCNNAVVVRAEQAGGGRGDHREERSRECDALGGTAPRRAALRDRGFGSWLSADGNRQPVQRAIEISQLFGSPRAPKNGADYSVLIRSAALSGGHTNRFKGRTGIKATTELAETSGKNRVLQFGALGRKSAGRAELFDSMRSVVD